MSAAEKNRDSIQNLEQELSTTHAEVARLKRTATEQARELTSLRHRLNSASSPRAAAAAAAAHTTTRVFKALDLRAEGSTRAHSAPPFCC
mmetsp:Transcript_22727/g.41678  ORF Transcript_22727/g.41678 Transcript_22727/m.41678 type:complete len:90 (-) Transcript_22727:188-457(-)